MCEFFTFSHSDTIGDLCCLVFKVIHIVVPLNRDEESENNTRKKQKTSCQSSGHKWRLVIQGFSLRHACFFLCSSCYFAAVDLSYSGRTASAVLFITACCFGGVSNTDSVCPRNLFASVAFIVIVIISAAIVHALL